MHFELQYLAAKIFNQSKKNVTSIIRMLKE